jgi:spore germination cell wall hydrolase CwlJ-like protein
MFNKKYLLIKSVKTSVSSMTRSLMIIGVFLTIAILTTPGNIKQPDIPLDVYSIENIQAVVTPPLLRKHKKPSFTSDIECLAKNIYYEARGESQDGMIAVGMVTINRSRDSSFSKSICGVVSQSLVSDTGEKICQFSWVCELTLAAKPVGARWIESLSIARMLLNGGHIDHEDLVEGAKYFHASNARPSWRKNKIKVAEIGNHVFYK